jgi:hypothetical protein
LLIKLAGHFIDNPQQIDKIIAIKGLPRHWFFRESIHGGEELCQPWEPDVEANIPASIRHLCEEMIITFAFPPISSDRKGVVEKRKVLALRLDFSRGPGQEMWEKIERYLEKSVPRDQAIPKPVLCAPNHRSEFSPHAVKRTVRGSMEMHPAEVPVIDVRESLTSRIPETKIEPQIEKSTTLVKEDPVKEQEVFPCKKCGEKFPEMRFLKGHYLRGHKKELIKEKVEV